MFLKNSKKSPELEPWWGMRSHSSQSLDHMGPCRSRKNFIFYFKYDRKLAEGFAQKSDMT